jgi:hypothetical protein
LNITVYMMKDNSLMSKKMMSNSNLKPICSVTEMIRMLEFSRGRFYQLLEQQIFPPPIYDLRTKRPFYTLDLQQLCLNIRESNVGFNGQYVLFYSPRKEKQANSSDRSDRKNKSQNSLSDELAQTLCRMGLSVDAQKVSSTIVRLFPDGTDDKDHGVLIRDLFRFFKNGVSQ